MENEDELAQLEQLLAADNSGDESEIPITSLQQSSSHVKLCEEDLFSEDSTVKTNEKIVENGEESSQIHNGDTDSSDDEDKRNCFEKKYNEYGSDVKKILEIQEQAKSNSKFEFEHRLRQVNLETKIRNNNPMQSSDSCTNGVKISQKNVLCAPEVKVKASADIYTDPVFGIRIIKPLISSSSLLERMQGRESINMLRVKRHVESGDLTKDWVLGGVIVRKSASKQSQKGSQFTIWTLSDLKDDLKSVTLFLFRNAYKELWKTNQGTVIAVLNPSVLDKRDDSTDQACLSVDSPDRIMILGQAKDLGICKSKKKNGEPCTAFVNVHQCEHCIFHVKQEYQKFSRRQELQSSTMGKGLVNLQNKVLGKNTVIYGGRTYSAIPVAKTKMALARDKNRLMSLSDYHNTTEFDNLKVNKSPYRGPIRKSAVTINPSGSQRMKDLDRLDKLQVSPRQSSINSTSTSSPIQSKLTVGTRFDINNTPKIGFGLQSQGTIDLNISYSTKEAERAKANALKWIQHNGPIKKNDPHNLKGTDLGKKRVLEQFNKSSSDSENECHKKKIKVEEKPKPKTGIMSERFRKILEATSSHQNLIELHDHSEQEKYFNKLEKKEAMEEKMLNTVKVACKAVRCLQCKYTSFSAPAKCKEERHPLKVFDALKRFFKCLDCGNRTVSLDLIPLNACSNCRSSRWEKTGMMREKKGVALADSLSIRGEEEKFIGSAIQTGANINLLVPDE